MKNLLPFLARLVVISLLLVPLLPVLHQSYQFVLTLVSTLPIGEVTNTIPYDASDSLYTFLILILATPGLKIKRRATGIISGAAIFLLSDSFMTAVWLPYLKTPAPSLYNMAVSYGWLVVVHYLLPFLLWFGFALKQIEELFKGQAQEVR